MAVSFESINTNTADNSDSLSITHPSGLSAGDLMVAGVAASTTSGTNTSSDDGFTLVQYSEFTDSTDFDLGVWVKEATSSDVTRGSSSWSDIGSNAESAGFVMRLSNAAATGNRVEDGGSDNTDGAGTKTVSSGITPVVADSFMVIIAAGAICDSADNYAIATDNPTWTERADVNTTTDSAAQISVATASRSETSSTGNVTFDVAGASVEGANGVIVSFAEKQNVTVNAGVLSATSSLQSTTESGNANVYQGFVDSGIVARWTLDENAANTNVADFTNTQPTATATQNTTNLSTTGQIGTAFDFNGSSDNVTVPHDASQLLTTALSMTMWVNADTLGGIVLDKSANGGGDGFSWQVGSSNYTFTVGSNAVAYGVGDPATGEWQHLAVTVASNGDFKAYKNGEVIFDTNTSLNPADITTNNDLTIGSENDDTDFFDGKIDDVRMYSRVLTEAEVAKIYDKERLKATATLQSSTQTTTSSPWAKKSRSTGVWTNKSK